MSGRESDDGGEENGAQFIAKECSEAVKKSRERRERKRVFSLFG